MHANLHAYLIRTHPIQAKTNDTMFESFVDFLGLGPRTKNHAEVRATFRLQ